MAIETAASRLKRAVRVARARSGLTSDTAVAQTAGVSYDTLMNWYSGRTTPRPAEVRKVASALGVPYDTLWAAYEGREPEPVPLQDAIRELVVELRLGRVQQMEATKALLAAVEALTGSLTPPRGGGGLRDARSS